MSKEAIFYILNDWNFWNKEVETGVERGEYLLKLKENLKSGLILVITGPRRSGKSFIMRQLARSLINSGVPKNEILLVNLEDPRFGELDARLLADIYETYLEFMRPVGKPYVFLDEAQEAPRWEKWTRSLHELSKAHVVVSGSNSKLLSRELATALTGRHLDTEVLPLSFREFLLFKNLTINSESDWTALRPAVNGCLREYLEFGGFPEVARRAENKKEILLSYFDDLVEHDLVRRYRTRKGGRLKELARFYCGNAAKLTTFTSAARFLDLSVATVEKFAGYLESGYLFYFLRRFSFKFKESEKSPRKTYAVDTGLAKAVGLEFSDNWGRHLENAVFLELLRRGRGAADYELFYWKDARHNEVDFAVKRKNKVSELIQVVWSMESAKTAAREKKSLLKAMDELNVARAVVVTGDYAGREQADGREIIFTPAARWLLSLAQ